MLKHIFKFIRAYEKPATQSEIRLGNGLILINLLSVILIIVFLFIPSAIIRPLLAVPFLMIFPGYTLLAAIFPNREQISGIERLVFSIGLSVAIAILLGLFLGSTPWEIKVEPVLYSLSALILLNSTIAWLRQIGLAKSQRFGFDIDLSWLIQQKSLTNSLITVTLIIAILGALSYMIYVSIERRVLETYSEFYILGQHSGLDNYPQVMTVGGEGSVYVGIVNHEGRDVIYSISVNPDSESSSTVEGILLPDGQNWEGSISFLVSTSGEDKKIEFVLYRDGNESPYRKLHLLIDATS